MGRGVWWEGRAGMGGGLMGWCRSGGVGWMRW